MIYYIIFQDFEHCFLNITKIIFLYDFLLVIIINMIRSAFNLTLLLGIKNFNNDKKRYIFDLRIHIFFKFAFYNIFKNWKNWLIE